MRKRELFLGFGAGLLVASASIALIQPKENASIPSGLTRETIAEAAKALEMVVLTREEYDELQQEKKVQLDPPPTPPQRPEAPTVGAADVPQTTPVQAPEVSTPEAATAPAGSVTQEPPAPDIPQTSGPESVQPPAPVTKVFSIPYRETAQGVARTLVEEGILQENNRLVEVLRAQNKLNRIRVGEYEVSLPVTEEQIVELITTPPQN